MQAFENDEDTIVDKQVIAGWRSATRHKSLKTQLTKYYLLSPVQTPVPVRISNKQHSLQDSAALYFPDGDLGHLHHRHYDEPDLVKDNIVSGGV